jgi:hypothetical protein
MAGPGLEQIAMVINGGSKTVREAEINPEELISGEIMIYRPQ